MADGENEVPMLIFTRRVGEMIRLGDDVFVRVGKIRPNRVGLQVIAPPYVSVHRGEVHAALRTWGREGRPSGW